MSTNKQYNARFVQKIDTEVNWNKASNFYPLKGELIVYAPDENYDYPRFKVGMWDGKEESKADDLLVSNLPFVLAADLLPLENGTEENSFKVKDFKDGTSNHVYGSSTIALGYGVTAGALSWRITSRSITEGYTDLYIYDPDHHLGSDCEGMRIGVRFNNNYDYCSTIGSVHGHNDNGEAFITVTPAIPAEDLAEGVGIDDTISDKNTLKIYDLPDAGYISTGNYSFAEGYSAQAQGMISHAEGYNTLAIGKYAHAEGHTTIAGYSAHSEGNRTQAIGWQSHSEGSATKALGNVSHAEGESTTASGKTSHAEGHGTEAAGWLAHAEGYNTKAIGNMSHTAGEGTEATASHQFVHGRFNTPDSNKAHIVGGGTSKDDLKNIYTLDWSGNAVFAGEVVGINGKSLSDNNFTTELKDKLTSLSLNTVNGAIVRVGTETSEANGIGAVAMGASTQATLRGATAFGIGTKATEEAAFAEGQSTIASGLASHAEGINTQATKTYAHAEGNTSKATGSTAHAEGHATTASGWASHSEGINTYAQHSGAHAEGNNTYAQSPEAHAEGLGVKALGEAHHAQGKYNVPNIVNNDYPTFGKYAHIVGGGNSDSDRKNIHTLDWDGNAWFAGTISATEVNTNTIKIGNTAFTEEQLIKILTFIEKSDSLLDATTWGEF